MASINALATGPPIYAPVAPVAPAAQNVAVPLPSPPVDTPDTSPPASAPQPAVPTSGSTVAATIPDTDTSTAPQASVAAYNALANASRSNIAGANIDIQA